LPLNIGRFPTAADQRTVPREFGWRGASGGGVRIAITPSAIPAGVALCAAGCWMYFGSKYGKTAERDKYWTD